MMSTLYYFFFFIFYFFSLNLNFKRFVREKSKLLAEISHLKQALEHANKLKEEKVKQFHFLPFFSISKP